MVSGSRKSRTFRRVDVKTPGGRVVIHYRERKPKKAHCAECGAVLSGMPRARPSKLAKLPKTMRRPERRFGGVLCSSCSRRRLIASARK